jgi:hypothetical protein
MKSFGEFVSHLIMSLVSVGVICAGLYLLAVFAVPAAWRSFQAGEAAKVTAHAQAGALAADATAANRQQANCSSELAHAADAFKAIAKASQPHIVEAGKPQPLIGVDQLNGAIQ